MIALAAVAVLLSTKPSANEGMALIQVLGVKGQGVDIEAVQRFFETQQGTLDPCYRTRSTMRLAFTIDPQGRATDVLAEADCVAVGVRAWVFPFKPKGPVRVEAKVLFEPQPPPSDDHRPPVIRGRVEVASPKALGGGIPPEDLERYVKSRKSGIQGCYEKELKGNPGHKDAMAVTFSITPLGRAANVAGDAKLEPITACVRAIVRGWVFPFKPEAEVPVSLGLTFTPAP